MYQTSFNVFRFASLKRAFNVRPLLSLEAKSVPVFKPDYPFLIDLTIENVSESTQVQINQLSTLSPTWSSEMGLPFAS